MKKLLLLCGIALVCMVSKAQKSPYYYYYEGQKQYFSLHTGYAFVSVKEQAIPFDTKSLNAKNTGLQSDGSDDKKQYQKQKVLSRFYTALKFEEKLSEEQYLKTLTDIKRQNKDVIISPYLKVEGSDQKIGLSNFFYVKLKDPADTKLLEDVAKQTKSVIVEQDPSLPLWFVMSVTAQSELNAMECSNLFYESGLFQAAEPSLISDALQCANDEHWGKQWGLFNTGQWGTAGIDIKACSAWQLSKGENVKVAVFDQGVQLNHPDLAANIDSKSYDVANKTPPCIIRENSSHGTSSAGIIGAVQNGIGISGVAPKCKLMSVSCHMDGYDPHSTALNPVLVEQEYAAGIKWSW